jgi:hypothetical protein
MCAVQYSLTITFYLTRDIGNRISPFNKLWIGEDIDKYRDLKKSQEFFDLETVQQRDDDISTQRITISEEFGN